MTPLTIRPTNSQEYIKNKFLIHPSHISWRPNLTIIHKCFYMGNSELPSTEAHAMRHDLALMWIQKVIPSGITKKGTPREE